MTDAVEQRVTKAFAELIAVCEAKAGSWSGPAERVKHLRDKFDSGRR
jgi:hypothetical protein